MKHLFTGFYISLVLLVSGCTVLVDDALSGLPDVDCRTATRGTECAEGRVCIDLACVPSICGDGVVYGTELCDDQNMTAGDGCEADCVPSCQSDAACGDGAACNGNEVCSAADAMGRRSCAAGTNLTDGTECSERGVVGRCATGVCGPCGNGSVDTGEECDDDNQVEGDGCDNDCTFSCESDVECSNADVCNGIETCDVALHVCEQGSPLDCEDNNDCSTDSCDPVSGCINNVSNTDADMDGFYSVATCPTVGTDCDDSNDQRYPGAPETCTDPVDKNCDGMPGISSTPTWYIDCDRDGYAANATGSMTTCSTPAAPGVCGGGQWVTRNPVGVGNFDCQDNMPLNEGVNPSITQYYETPYTRTGGSTSYDYNCTGVLERQYTQDFFSAASGHTAPCGSGGLVLCSGSSWWVASSLPTCGANASRSYCGYVNRNGFFACERVTASTVVRCR